ncbi:MULTISPECIES: transcriptional regulator MelR [Citrobacter]|uniref:Transcriptional regulator MelR n=1 Tax=Citrobacter telavivensis TaxID=2653932 RepID=A0A6L5E477_9ENTR|nr:MULTISPECIES: transcriptional regulator MelR [Citrobacter]MPQ50327.1 transcriptional regulator MelR [Citrobacter telavivensis]QFS71612.1 transcriptional regulator MelR [Citrobacter telavivensis]CAI9397009.1 Melibiose operon regulatory protein [Citrobacter sp. T1.2D-1]
MADKNFPRLPYDPHMCRSYDKQTKSPLALYSESQKMDIELRAPLAMSYSHWHGQIEINIPFDGDVEYLINDEAIKIHQGHVTLFWACTPHQLTDPGHCQKMAIFNLPMHLFLSWPLDRELVNHVTHGRVIQSQAVQQLSVIEVQRWQHELNSKSTHIRQLAIDEIALMLKRFSLSGWAPVSVSKASYTLLNGTSRHAQFYVSQMLEFIAANCDKQLTVNDIADHVKLNANYAMGIFKGAMQLSIKQYIMALRINHVRALLSDTDKTILDIAMLAGFTSSSRFYSIFKNHVGMAPKEYRKLSQERRYQSI